MRDENDILIIYKGLFMSFFSKNKLPTNKRDYLL